MTQTMTRDNVAIRIKATTSFRIVNPIISHYVLGNQLEHIINESASASLREVIGEYNLDKVLTSRAEIANKSKEKTMVNLPQGILLDRIFLESLILDPDVEKDLSSVARQKRLS